MAKKATIYHSKPKRMPLMMLVPYGLYANKELQKAEIGATLTFQSAWQKDEYKLIRRTRIKVRSGVFTFMLRAIYDQSMTYERWMQHWRGIAASEGWGRNCYNTDAVYLLELEEI